MMIAIWMWMNENPERWVPIVGSLFSLLAVALKSKAPRVAHVLNTIAELFPNLPGFLSKLRGSKPVPPVLPGDKP